MQLLSCVFIGGLFPYPYCDGILRVLAKILPHFINLAPELQLLNMHWLFFGSGWSTYLHIIVSNSNYCHITLSGPFQQMCKSEMNVSCLVLHLHHQLLLIIDGMKFRSFRHVKLILKDCMSADELLFSSCSKLRRSGGLWLPNLI